MNKTSLPAPLSFDRSKLKSLIRHFDIRLDVEKTDNAPWVGDAALMQVVHHGTSILIPGGTESALFLLARTFVAIEMLTAIIGAVPGDDIALADEAKIPTAQFVIKFVTEMTAVGDATSKVDAAGHLSRARAALARISSTQFEFDLIAHIRETAGRMPRDH